MATTRNHKQIDEALRRPGRMDRVFHLQSPTEMERERILHNAAEETMDRELVDLVDWRKVILSFAKLFMCASDYICFTYRLFSFAPSKFHFYFASYRVVLFLSCSLLYLSVVLFHYVSYHFVVAGFREDNFITTDRTETCSNGSRK